MRGVAHLVLCLMLFSMGTITSNAQGRYEFGFSLNPTAQGGLNALFIYTTLEGRVVGSIPMRLQPFILQASGVEESKANLESVDLFDQYEIQDCGIWADKEGLQANLECSPLLDVWKLRYKHGMGAQPGNGWAAEEFRPSERQQIILQMYRSPEYEHWHGPYFGKNAFRLLHDMQDPAWVDTYQNGG